MATGGRRPGVVPSSGSRAPDGRVGRRATDCRALGGGGSKAQIAAAGRRWPRVGHRAASAS
jgi:hypothetical protein